VEEEEEEEEEEDEFGLFRGATAPSLLPPPDLSVFSTADTGALPPPGAPVFTYTASKI